MLVPGVDIEPKAYGPECRPEELMALRRRVSVLKPGLILYRELPVVTGFTIDLMFKQVKQVSSSWDAYSLIIDLSNAGRPSAAARHSIVRRFNSLARLERIILVMGGNVLIRVASKFILAGVLKQDIVTVTTLDEATNAVERD